MERKDDSDSDDSDIIEVKRIKPVINLTRERAMEIKKMILANENESSYHQEEYLTRSVSCDSCQDVYNNRRAKKRKSSSDKIWDESGDVTIISVNPVGNHNNPKQGKECAIKPFSIATTPVKGNRISPNNSPSKLITDFYSPNKSSSPKAKMRKSDGSEPVPSVSTENIQLSPGIKKRKKKFKLGSPSVRKEANQNGSQPVADQKILVDLNTKLNESSIPQKDHSVSVPIRVKKKPKVSENSYLYGQSVKKIIHHELKNQQTLEEKAAIAGKEFQKLFSHDECEYIQKLFHLPEKACQLYSRMLCRKKYWNRVTNISYSDISDKLEDVFRILHKAGFVDLDIEKESMEVQLDLLTKPEVQILCKTFNIKVLVNNAKKKDFIDAIVKSSKNQKSLVDMWKKNNDSTRLMLLQSEILRMLGTCVKLNELVLQTFDRILLLFSLTHNVMDEDRWTSQIQMMIEVYFSIIHYPNYTVNPTVIFEVRDDLISYQKSLKVMWEFESAVANKSYSDFFVLAQKAKKKFAKAIANEPFKQRHRELPSYLKRYSAGTVYARILSTYCEKYKKKTPPEEKVEILSILVDQDLFLVRKKGHWYSLLSQSYEELGRVNDAVSVLLKGLQDENISDVDRFTIQLRGQLILKKKKKGLGDCQLRDELDNACTINISEPSRIEIKAKALGSNEPGFKIVYVQESASGKVYSSVEEHAIQYYKRNGFTHGIHSEGFVVQTLYFLIFFDIIYGNSPPGVFQSPYQIAPLDFYSRSFYLNRKEAVDTRLREMRGWSHAEVESILTKVYEENCGVSCVITWKDNFDLKMLCDLVRCMGMSALSSICERLVMNYKVMRSGFPDLTIWNVDTGKCKFVEVKSPNDKLSPKQRLWLDFLRRLDVDCEVCNVRNTASKKSRFSAGKPTAESHWES